MCPKKLCTGISLANNYLLIYTILMSKQIQVFKALMVKPNTHKKVVVKAKIQGITVDKFISNLLKGNEK